MLYDSLSQTVPDTAAALHVWPETAAPCYMSVDRYCQARAGSIASRSGAYHLVGALGVSYPDGVERHFNSCYQFNPEGQLEQRYDKVKLVPFSEQAPYQDHLPFLKAEVLSKYLSFIKTYDVQWWSDFYPGDTAKVFEIPDVTYGVLICFECTFPEYVRKMVRMGADYMVGITNDTWFHNSLGIYMHARIFITRAVENRIWMARSANSGLTFIVDPYGRIRQQLEYNEVGALVGKVGRLEEYSVFTRIGDVAGLVSFLILAAVIAILVVSWLIQKISRRSQSVA